MLPAMGETPSDPKSDLIGQRVLTEQVQVIYKQAPPASLISIVVAGILCFILWPLTEHRLLLGWFAVMATLGVARLGLVFFYRRRKDDTQYLAWERPFLVSLVLTGLAWGVGGWLI